MDWKEEANRLFDTTNLSRREIGIKLGIPKSTVIDLLAGRNRDHRLPKILIFDIETAPTLAWTWRRWNENISHDQVIRDGYVITWAAKWLGEDAIMSDSLFNNQRHYWKSPEDDKNIMSTLWKLMDEADILVAHNGDKFDIPLVNARFLKHGFDQPSPYKAIDTLKIARKQFRFESNQLKSIGRYLGEGEKLETGGFGLWRDCMNGVPEAWEKMLAYNCEDTCLLERIYMRLRPWHKGHPNVSLYGDNGKMRCVCCGSEDLLITDKHCYTSVSQFSVWKCRECRKFNRARVNTKSKEQRENVLTNAL